MCATGSALDTGGSSRFYVKPIRTDGTSGKTALAYNSTSGEITNSNVDIYNLAPLAGPTFTGIVNLIGMKTR